MTRADTDTDTPTQHNKRRIERRVPISRGSHCRRQRISLSTVLTGLLAALFCITLVWPFIFGAGWRAFHHSELASANWHAVVVSLLCATADAVLMIVFATPLAWILARRDFPGKVLLEALTLIPLLTPPLAMGMLLANMLGPESVMGQLAGHLDISLTNSIPALIIAGFYAAAPFYVFAAKLAFASVAPGYEEIAGLLGKSRTAIWFGITLPLAMGGLFWAIVIAWLRALGEFGVAIIIAYFPHGIPIQMWVNLQDAGPRAVYPLLWILILAAMPIPLLLSLQAAHGWGGWLNLMGQISKISARFNQRRQNEVTQTAAAMPATWHDPARPLNINMYIDYPVQLTMNFQLLGVTTLTGATGSGKTTLLRAIAGLIPSRPAAETLEALAASKIGYAPQHPLLFPHLNVWRNITFGIHFSHLRPRAIAILRQFGIEHLVDKMPGTLSAGQAQLVSVARAIVRDPDILLLDEPTAALDFETADLLMRILREIVRTTNLCILMATHDRDIARSADTWLTIGNGTVDYNPKITSP